MSHTRSLNGRPEPEVIVNFQDGYSYSKGKMEEVFKSDFFNRPPTKNVKENYNVKKDDVDLIVNELEIPRVQAERALAQAKGNVADALIALITPTSK